MARRSELQHLHNDLSVDQAQQATELTAWASRDKPLAGRLAPELERLRRDERRSVASRVSRRLAEVVELDGT